MLAQTDTQTQTDTSPVLEQLECRECGTVTLDGKCLSPECGTAASQSIPKGSIRGSVIAAPSAFTIRGGVD